MRPVISEPDWVGLVKQLTERIRALEAELKKEHDRAEYNAWAAAKNASAKMEQIGKITRNLEEC